MKQEIPRIDSRGIIHPITSTIEAKMEKHDSDKIPASMVAANYLFSIISLGLCTAAVYTGKAEFSAAVGGFVLINFSFYLLTYLFTASLISVSTRNKAEAPQGESNRES